MPKYDVTYEKNKTKIIRASSLEVAEERAHKGEVNGWVVVTVRELPKE